MSIAEICPTAFIGSKSRKENMSLKFGSLEHVHCLLEEQIIKSYSNREAQMQLALECNVICAAINRHIGLTHTADNLMVLWQGAVAEHAELARGIP